MARPILQLQATDEEVLELGRLVRGTKVSVGDRFRARIILLRLEGRSETEVARTLGCSMGRHRPLFGSARAGFSALLRREESVPSIGAHTTPPSSEEGLRTHSDP